MVDICEVQQQEAPSFCGLVGSFPPPSSSVFLNPPRIAGIDSPLKATDLNTGESRIVKDLNNDICARACAAARACVFAGVLFGFLRRRRARTWSNSSASASACAARSGVGRGGVGQAGKAGGHWSGRRSPRSSNAKSFTSTPTRHLGIYLSPPFPPSLLFPSPAPLRSPTASGASEHVATKMSSQQGFLSTGTRVLKPGPPKGFVESLVTKFQVSEKRAICTT
jgi:hypothetical protein